MHARFEPLPVTRVNQDAYDTAAALREHLGKWAHIANVGNRNRATNLSYRIRTGRHAAFRPGGAFEAQARTAEDGTADVYARYIGDHHQ
ncbi:hypothetical protein [Streptomyces sp. NBC_01304]|uniref:hypothetical protein n=1 Tax=Streptomyces sp. NBC_01304 TaxID=2903818 RepID=UPI002E12E1F1|nr:hypothetical protein OG430_33650 [Streptomyces sp. NBC_01304]